MPVSGIALDAREFGLASRYLRHRFLVPETESARRDARVLAALRQVARNGRPLVVPEYDPNLDVILRRWDDVRELADVPLPPDAAAVRRLRRKDLLPAEAAAAGVPAPATVVVEDEEALRRAALRPPLLLKPVADGEFARVFGQKAFAARDREEAFAAWRRARENGFAVVVQELVPDAHDRVFSLFTYIGRDGEPLASVVGRKVRQWPLDFGTGTVFETRGEERVLELGLKLLRHAEYRGFAEVEFAHDPRDGEFKLVEVNTRIPLWAGLAMSRYLDIARVAYDDVCGRPPPQAPRVLGGDVAWIYLVKDAWAGLQLARRGELRLREFVAPYVRRRKVRALFAADDLRPVLASLSYLASRGPLRRNGGRR